MKAACGGLVASILLASAAAAQAPGLIVGRVADSATGAPVAAARIEIEGQSTSSGADGRFRLDGVPAGTWTLLVTAVGYAPARQLIELLPGFELQRTFRLAAVTPVLPDLVVRGAVGGEARLDHEALMRRGADLATAIDGWEGVVVRRSGGNGPASPQVRGSAPEEVVVLVDGFAINDPLTGRADLSRLPTRDLSSVQVRPGAQFAGGAGASIGGVIEVRSRSRGRTDATGWLGSYGSGGGSISASVGEARLFLHGERLADGFPYHVPANRGGGEAVRTNAGGSLGSLSFRKSGPLSVQVRASLAQRGLPGPVGNESPNATAADGAAFVGITVDGASRWSGSLQYLQSTAQDPAPPSGPAYGVRSEGVSGTLDWSRDGALSLAGWGGALELGASARHDAFGGDIVQAGTQFTRGGIRATASLHPAGNAAWTMTPSARLDLWTGAAHPLASARLDAAWQRGGRALHASVGSAVSAPPLADLFFREGVGVALNPALRPERVRWEVELGASQEWSVLDAPASFSIRGYYGLVRDMILWAPGVGFVWSPRNYNVVRRGVDASLRLRPLSTVSLELQAAWTPITYDVPDGAQVQYRPRGTWGAVATWAEGRWGADARWHWVGERYPNPGGVNPRPAFGLMDVGIERSIGGAGARLAVRDLFDSRAEFLAGYPTPGRTAIFSISLEWQ